MKRLRQRLRVAWERATWWSPLFTRAVALWAVVIVVTVLVRDREGQAWVGAGEILTTLSAELGAVVIGALVVDRWRIHEERRAQRLWVAAASDHLTSMQASIRQSLAVVAVTSYAAARPLLLPDERIPSDLIRFVVEKLPPSPPRSARDGDLPDDVQQTLAAIETWWEDTFFLRLNGPLQWVAWQIEDLRQSAAAANLARSAWLPDDARKKLKTGRLALQSNEEQSALAEVADAQPTLLSLADDVNGRVRDLCLLDVFSPARLALSEARETEGDLTVIRLLNSTRDLISQAHALANARELEDLLEVLARLVAGVKEVLRMLREWTTSLAEFAAQVGRPATVNELFAAHVDAVLADSAAAMRRVHKMEWDRFVRHATPLSPYGSGSSSPAGGAPQP